MKPEKKHLTDGKAKIKITADFSSETMQTNKQSAVTYLTYHVKPSYDLKRQPQLRSVTQCASIFSTSPPDTLSALHNLLCPESLTYTLCIIPAPFPPCLLIGFTYEEMLARDGLET